MITPIYRVLACRRREEFAAGGVFAPKRIIVRANENRKMAVRQRVSDLSTKVPLRGRGTDIKWRAMGSKVVCEEHNRLRHEAVTAVLEARRIRWSKDLSFYQDSELSRDEHKKIDALLKHLLVGHDGKPCPSGDRPIVTTALGGTPAGQRRQLIRTDHSPQAKCS
jgi:hypothetical protein